jgi:hypothetical protein
MPPIEDQFEDTLLIGNRDTRAILAIASRGRYELPIVRTAAHHPADVDPTRRAIREQLRLRAVVLLCHFDAPDSDTSLR